MNQSADVYSQARYNRSFAALVNASVYDVKSIRSRHKDENQSCGNEKRQYRPVRHVLPLRNENKKGKNLFPFCLFCFPFKEVISVEWSRVDTRQAVSGTRCTDDSIHC